MDASGMHGASLELKNVEVVGLSDGKFTLTAFKPGWRENLGPMAHLSVDGVDILVSTLRNQTFCPAVFTKHGIDVNTCGHRCIRTATSSQIALLML
jgi:microcystin degradation protein MlrC